MTLYRAARHRAATIARLLSGKYIKRYESLRGVYKRGLRFSNVLLFPPMGEAKYFTYLSTKMEYAYVTNLLLSKEKSKFHAVFPRENCNY